MDCVFITDPSRSFPVRVYGSGLLEIGNYPFNPSGKARALRAARRRNTVYPGAGRIAILSVPTTAALDRAGNFPIPGTKIGYFAVLIGDRSDVYGGPDGTYITVPIGESSVEHLSGDDREAKHEAFLASLGIGTV